uniref:Uncharacterized protein n=1 Tax=Manihot esculenta TaxID=3983 RepID=A0A2C9WK77_MANES
MEVGFSGNQPPKPFFSRSVMGEGVVSRTLHCLFLQDLRGVYDAKFEDHQPHLLEARFLCKKLLDNSIGMFMDKREGD